MMKKLLLLTTLCFATFVQAVTKDDLEKAVRTLDVRVVKQIVESEQFTQREYDRYLALAEEVVRNREALYLNMYTTDDVQTPYEGPSLKRLFFECTGVGILFKIFRWQSSDLESQEWYKKIFLALQAAMKEALSRVAQPEWVPEKIVEDLPVIIKSLEAKVLKMKLIWGIAGAASLILFGKLAYDCVQAKNAWDKRKVALRKKYEDAVSIKQLIYTADITEA